MKLQGKKMTNTGYKNVVFYRTVDDGRLVRQAAVGLGVYSNYGEAETMNPSVPNYSLRIVSTSAGTVEAYELLGDSP